MKLIDFVIDETTVELTYSDAPEGIHGDHFAQVRMPRAGSYNRSLNWHQVNILEQTIDALTELRSQAMRELQEGD